MALLVKKSQIPDAGLGLFTSRAIREGNRIIEYRGEIITWKDYKKRVEDDKDGYLFFVNNKRCIDAYATPQYKARYANDAEGLSRVPGLRNNAIYQIFGDKCYIVADRDIRAGEEIFVEYTDEYWDAVKYNLRHKLYKRKKTLRDAA
jgi:SET domain-containing protein